MSAYVVDDSTINRILAAAWQWWMAGRGRGIPPIPREWGQHSWPENAPELGAEMRAMNVAAVKARYPDDADDELPGPRPLLPYKWESEACPSIEQVIKSLDCYLYQCAEGDIPETWELYNVLRNWQLDLCYHIVNQSKQYQDAEWA